MKTILYAVTGLGFLMSASALAAENPIATRKAIMKNVGAAAKIGGAMAKGEMEYNAAAGELVLRTMHAAALGFGDLFPEGSQTGGETTASTKIWEDRAGFDAVLVKFQEAAGAGAEAKPADLDAFKAAFGAAAQNCKTCHEGYRIKKE